MEVNTVIDWVEIISAICVVNNGGWSGELEGHYDRSRYDNQYNVSVKTATCIGICRKALNTMDYNTRTDDSMKVLQSSV